MTKSLDTVAGQKLQRIADLVAMGEKGIPDALKEATALVSGDKALKPVLRTLVDDWAVSIEQAREIGVAGLVREVIEAEDEKTRVSAAKALTSMGSMGHTEGMVLEERRTMKLSPEGVALFAAIARNKEDEHARDIEHAGTAKAIPISPDSDESGAALTDIIDIAPA